MGYKSKVAQLGFLSSKYTEILLQTFKQKGIEEIKKLAYIQKIYFHWVFLRHIEKSQHSEVKKSHVKVR